MSHEDKTVTTDIPLPPRPQAPRRDAEKPARADALPPAPTVGSFYAEHRALIDGRKADLARVGMLPEHAKALAMPDLSDKPLMLPLPAESMPTEAGPERFEPKKMPKPEGAVLEA